MAAARAAASGHKREEVRQAVLLTWSLLQMCDLPSAALLAGDINVTPVPILDRLCFKRCGNELRGVGLGFWRCPGGKPLPEHQLSRG